MGIHYHFISQHQFDVAKAAGDLLELAEVHGSSYGTPRAPVEAVLVQGRDMLFDIDWQGAQQMREALGGDVVSDLHPAAVDGGTALAARPARGGFGGDHRQEARQSRKREIERWRQYDYVVINDDLQRAYAQVVAIIAAERTRCARVAEGVEGFVADLLKS